MNTDEMPARIRIMLLTLLGLVCAFGLFDHSLWSGNDTREGAMISEMVRTRCWVAPIFNGVHYLEKPPLLHWTGACFCRVFGNVSEGLVRLPAAFYAFGTLLIIVAWGRRLNREAAGFAAAFMCAVSVLFFEYARIVLTDSALTFMVVFSLWLFWRAYTAEKPLFRHYLLFLAVAAFSFYAKGLIGPGMIWIAVVAWLSFQRRFQLLFVLLILFAFVFMAVLAPWVFALWKTGGSAYLYKVFWENQFGRFLYFNDPTLPIDPYLIHKEPIYFYLLSLPIRLLPWPLLVIPALYYWFKRESPIRDDLAFFLRTNLLAILFLLHISSAKAACYALPSFPVIFLMTAIWLEDATTTWSSRIDRNLIIATFALIGLAIIIVPVAYLLAFIIHLPVVWAPGTKMATVSFLVALGAALAGFILARKFWPAFQDGRLPRAFLVMPVAAALLGIIGISAFIPAIDYYRTYVPFSKMVRDEAGACRRLAFASDSERDLGAFMFYLDTRLDIVSFANRASLDNFLRNKKEMLGIIVPTKDLKFAIDQLRNMPVKIRRSDHGGRKSDSFRLVVINPVEKGGPKPAKPKPGKPKRTRK